MSAIGGPNIIEDGLVLSLDAGNHMSYPGSGTTWNDLSGFVPDVFLGETIPTQSFTDSSTWVGVLFTGTRTGDRSFTTPASGQGLATTNIMTVGVRYNLILDIDTCEGTFQFRNNSGNGSTNLILQVSGSGTYDIEFDAIDTSIYLRAATALNIVFNSISLKATSNIDYTVPTNIALTNGAYFSNGSMVFDGTNDYGISSYYLPISGNAEFTISYFAKWNGDTFKASAGAVGNNTTGITNRGLSSTWYNGKVSLTFWINRFIDDYPLEVKKWYYISITKTPGLIGSTTKIYVNGNLRTGVVEGTDVTPDILPSNFIVGRLFATDAYFDGGISQVRIYNRALSADEILQNYNATKGRFGL